MLAPFFPARLCILSFQGEMLVITRPQGMPLLQCEEQVLDFQTRWREPKVEGWQCETTNWVTFRLLPPAMPCQPVQHCRAVGSNHCLSLYKQGGSETEKSPLLSLERVYNIHKISSYNESFFRDVNRVQKPCPSTQRPNLFCLKELSSYGRLPHSSALLVIGILDQAPSRTVHKLQAWILT